MPTYYTNKENGEKHKIGTVYMGNKKIGQIYKGSQLVYQSAFRITYVIDTNRSYVEKVVPNKTILTPKTFTPAKEGWVFVGWRKDTVASSSVLTEAYSTGHTTLYAVFRQAVTCTFKSYDSTKTASGTRYYNNGTLVNATVTIPTGASYSGWTWRGWSAAGDTKADATVVYSNGAQISELTENQTYYGLYTKKTSQATSWKCGWCGLVKTQTSKPSSCSNNVCGSKTGGQKWNVNTSKSYTHYYSGSGNSVKY